jgi:5-methylthioadenosine/S-adenosylhomocysteine deaminase
MPGLVNAHTHLPMSLFRGLADDHPFNEWLFQTILPLETSLVCPEFVRAGTELSLLECIRTGTTTVCDMYYFEDVVADAMDRSGVRGLAGQALIDFPVPDDRKDQGTPLTGPLAMIESMELRYQGHSRVRPAIAPHAPYSCSDETLLKARDAALASGVPLTIHLAETEHEVRESLKNYGKTPTRRLADLGILALKPICAHGVHLNDEDIELLAASGASVVYNAESNMKLGSGVARIPKLLEAGVTVAIGTDGPASNNDLSILRELDTGAKLQKLVNHSNTAMTAAQALRLATWEGARALGLGAQIGSLEVGKKADLIALDLQRPHLQPIHDLVSHVVYSATGQEVEWVLCDGRVLYEPAGFTTLDAPAIIARAGEWALKIREHLAGQAAAGRGTP